jgi:hypothetical protein
VTVLIVGTSVEGGDLDGVVATVGADRAVRRATSLAAVREALPDCSAVVVGTSASPSASAVRETVRSGVYCDPTTPVVRLVSDPDDPDEPADAADYDGAVPADSPEAVLEVLRGIERTDDYRDAVEDLYEVCRENARGEDVDAAHLAAAFERADRAFESLPEVAGWTPYGRVFADAAADPPAGDDETEDGAGDEADDDG